MRLRDCGPGLLTQPRRRIGLGCVGVERPRFAQQVGTPALLFLAKSPSLWGDPHLPAPAPKQKAIHAKTKCLGTAWQVTGLEVARVQLVQLTYFQEMLNCQAGHCS